MILSVVKEYISHTTIYIFWQVKEITRLNQPDKISSILVFKMHFATGLTRSHVQKYVILSIYIYIFKQTAI